MKNNLLKKVLCATLLLEMASTTMSYTSNFLETDKANYNTITKHIERKCTEDNDFKNNFDELVQQARENYLNMRNFINNNNSCI